MILCFGQRDKDVAPPAEQAARAFVGPTRPTVRLGLRDRERGARPAIAQVLLVDVAQRFVEGVGELLERAQTRAPSTSLFASPCAVGASSRLELGEARQVGIDGAL